MSTPVDKQVAIVLVEEDGDRQPHRFETVLSAGELAVEMAQELRGSAASQVKVEVVVG